MLRPTAGWSCWDTAVHIAVHINVHIGFTNAGCRCLIKGED